MESANSVTIDGEIQQVIAPEHLSALVLSVNFEKGDPESNATSILHGLPAVPRNVDIEGLHARIRAVLESPPVLQAVQP